jgi:MYXO-CTERM domain-containing protein
MGNPIGLPRDSTVQRISLLTLALSLFVASSASADTITLDDVAVGAPGQGSSVGTHYFSVSSAYTVSVLVDAPSWYDPNYISTHAYLFTSSGAVIGSSVGLLNGNAGIVAQLAAGTYVLAVGDFPLTPQEAWTGVNQPDLWENLGIGANAGSYDVTISARNADLAWVGKPGTGGDGAGTNVPELNLDDSSSGLMLLLGGVAMIAGRRRRAAQAG